MRDSHLMKIYRPHSCQSQSPYSHLRPNPTTPIGPTHHYHNFAVLPMLHINGVPTGEVEGYGIGWVKTEVETKVGWGWRGARGADDGSAVSGRGSRGESMDVEHGVYHGRMLETIYEWKNWRTSGRCTLPWSNGGKTTTFRQRIIGV